MKHVLLLLTLGLALGLALGACSGDDPAPKPDRATVEAMRSFCKLGETPFEHRGLAMAHWVEHYALGSHPVARAGKRSQFAATWGAMIRGDKRARKKIEAAADAAVGKGKCDMLESFGKP